MNLVMPVTRLMAPRDLLVNLRLAISREIWKLEAVLSLKWLKWSFLKEKYQRPSHSIMEQVSALLFLFYPTRRC